MSSSFKVYLPSNACKDAFPKNTPTDYYTRFDKSINLKGDWEVGVESIAYSSHINDSEEQAHITLVAEGLVTKSVHTLIRDKFRLSEDGQWKGLKGIVPDKYENDGKNIDKIMKTLNAMNHLILEERASAPIIPLFTFARDKKGRVYYENRDVNFSLQITEKLSKVLGFGGMRTFTAIEYFVATEKFLTSKEDLVLTKEDYFITYAHIEVQKKEMRIIMKDQGETFDGKEGTLLKLWNDNLSKMYKVRLQFDSEHKLSIYNNEENLTFVLSYDLCRALGCSQTIIGKQNEKSKNAVIFNSNFLLESWHVDVYSTKMETTQVLDTVDNIQLHLYPWRSRTVRQLLQHINTQVRSVLASALRYTFAYNETDHNFQLTMAASGHCKLELGYLLKAVLSPNLAYLLSLPVYQLRGPIVLGTREIDVLEAHLRQLVVLSNVIKPTSSGEQERHIICDFLHKSTSDIIVEKHFLPISYHPVARNTIDEIHIQLTDSRFQPIAINDIKSIVTLYFRKVK